MKKISLLVFLIFCSLFVNISAQQSVPIITLRQNDSNGSPVNLGKQFTVSGIVTVSNNFGSSGPGAIEDTTAGISIYGSGFAGAVQIGDSVVVTSTLAQYKGMTQFDFSSSGSKVTIISSGHAVKPKLVTLEEISSQQWNGVEKIEGELVRINNVTISGTGVFEGNKNYTISDTTGSLQLRIDKDVSSLVGTAIPSGKIDLIGIVGQYKYSAPYNSGYQVLPRDINDLVTAKTPIILSPVVASNIKPNSFTVYFKTLRKGNSVVKYGKTEALELDSVVVNDDTTYHVVQITGLEELTKYYFKVFSTNNVGTSQSTLQSVITASSNPKVGAINVYFNYSVDNSVAIPGNDANGNVDFRSKLINRINSATYSIDIALYSFFGLNNVQNALIAAKQRGVKIRFVYDHRTTQSGVQALLDAGIKMSERPDNNGLMHNKFAVFDGRDSNQTNDWVWTGSWNWTSLEMGWKNNVIEINSPALAEAYTKEFNEMWGSNTDTPNPANAKFGPNKSDITSHSFSVRGTPIQLYFSPSDQTESHIDNAITTADSSIYFAMYAFTSDGIFNTIESRSTAGVSDIRGVIGDVNATGSEYNSLLNIAPNEIFQYTGSGNLHDKYGIIDASYPSSNPIVISGSHNWSRSANEKNDENTLIIHNIYIANQYMQDFKQRYNAAGGTTAFVVPVVSSVKMKNYYPNRIELYQNYPNPFNPITTITFFMPNAGYVSLSVYNLLGQKVKDIFTGRTTKGLNVFDFNGENLASGVYIYLLKTKNNIYSKKLILLK